MMESVISSWDNESFPQLVHVPACASSVAQLVGTTSTSRFALAQAEERASLSRRQVERVLSEKPNKCV